MALASAPGSESPSPAYLAGAQHGTQLAVQHHIAANAKPQPVTPAQQPAAPTSDPANGYYTSKQAAAQAAASNTQAGVPVSVAFKPGRGYYLSQKGTAPAQTQTAPGQFDLAGLLAHAQALAQAQTSAQVKAIQAQQDLYRNAAADRANQINAAAQAEARFLAPLGDQTAASYTDAAKALGSLAGGFSGQVGTDATNAANDIQANLASLGAPAGSVRTSTGQTSSPDALKNVLYGLGGFIPGNLLLTSGQGAAAAARALPAGALGAGQQQASGAIASGETQAQGLTPAIIDAQGKQPGLAQSLYNSLLDGIYKQANLAATQTRLSQGQQRIDQTASNNAFNQNYKTATYNFSVTKAQWQQSNADRTYGLNYAKYVASEKKAAALAANGGLSTTARNALAAKVQDFTKSVYQGVPQHVIYPSHTDTAASWQARGGNVDVKTGQLLPTITSWKQKPLTYQQAIRTLVNRYPSLGASAAIRAANQWYQPGEGGRPLYTGTAAAEIAAVPPITKGAPVPPPGYAPNTYGKAPSTASNPAGYLTAGGFLPSTAKFSVGRADQGRDIQTAAGTPIVAPGAGVVVAVKSDLGGGGGHFGPAYPVVHFTSGPYAGKTIYIGHTVAALKPGQSFTAGAVLSHTQQSGPLNGGAPDGWAEIGFAPGGTPGSFGQPVPFG